MPSMMVGLMAHRHASFWVLLIWVFLDFAVARKLQAKTGYSVSTDPSMVHSLYIRQEFIEALATFLTDDKAASVLELGAGSGRIARMLANLGFDTVAVENNPHARNSSVSFLGYSVDPARPRPHKAPALLSYDLTKPLPFERSFDWVLALGILEHIPFEHEATVLLNIHTLSHAGIILSWAPRGMSSAKHTNPRNSEEILALFFALGYENDPVAQQMLLSASWNEVESEDSLRAFHSELVYVLRRRVSLSYDHSQQSLQENVMILRKAYDALAVGRSLGSIYSSSPKPPSCCTFLEDMHALVKVSHYSACFDTGEFTFERCCQDELRSGVGVSGPPCFPGGGDPSREECCGWNPLGGQVPRIHSQSVGPKVVFYHLEKAGGMSAKTYLRSALVGPLTIVRETDVMKPDLWESDFFKVGVIREPCAYYLSLYRWGISQGGEHWLARHLKQQGLGERFYGGGGSKGQFKDFVMFLSGTEDDRLDYYNTSEELCGLMSMRLWTQILNPTTMDQINAVYDQSPACNEPFGMKPCPCPLGDFVRLVPAALRAQCHRDIAGPRLAEFDCWLRTERLQDDFSECMAKFSSRGGLLFKDWHQRALQAHNQMTPVVCEDWYDPELAAFVERRDGALARRFGYSGKCCEQHPHTSMPKL